MRRFAALLSLSLAAAAASVSPASAATCSSFPNQAAAQRAHNTRDADHDGIFCESLPCPCSTSAGGGSRGGGSGSRGARRALKPGRSIAFGFRSLSTGCRLRQGRFPDPRCTPGAYFSGATRSMICVKGYSARVRNVTPAMKRHVYASYGITHHSRGQYEIDHLVPLEGGGSNAIENLFPEPAYPKPGFHQKDVLENRMRAKICSGAANLRATQRAIARNWLGLYNSWF